MVDNIVKNLPFWKDLNDKQKQFITSNSVIKHYEKGNFIGDGACLGMINMVSGQIRTYLMSEEGREITLFRIEEGESCVLSASCVIEQITFDIYLVAETDCDILLIPSSVFNKLAEENIYVKCYMYEIITERFSAVMWTMQQILFKKFDHRLADYLLDIYDKTGNAEIKTTQEQIAIEVNSAREVVARMLKIFAGDGLVEIKRGSIVLKNIKLLRSI